MSCTVCPTNSKCPHIKQPMLHSIITNGKIKKPPKDEDAIAPCESSSGDASGDRPPGFIKYLKRCFKLHFRGNSSKKHKSRTVIASESVETVSPVPEVNSVNTPIINPPNSLTVSPDFNTPTDPQTSSKSPTSPSNHAPSPTKPIASTPDPVYAEGTKSNQSGTANAVNSSKKSLAVEFLNLSKYGWYWGPITQAEAVEKLLDEPDGSFLVRDSYADHFLVSMSFKTLGRIYHTRINHSNGHFFFYTSPEHSCASIPELIEVSMDSSKSSIFCYSRPSSPFSPSLPIRLTKPVSRFTEVRSLQHLCRFVIRQYTRIDQIKQLPLPNKLCGFLEAKKF